MGDSTESAGREASTDSSASAIRDRWAKTAKRRDETAIFEAADRLWLAPVLIAGVAVYLVYLATHQYPGFGAGLYMQIAEEIVGHGYGFPERIPYYTADGVPFAYPPLMFYVSAVILDLTGVDPITLSRFLPGLVTIAYLVPIYLLVRDVRNSRPEATAAALLVAVNPQILKWHISAGGVVRAPAVFFALCGIYAGYHLFRSGERRWLVASLVLFTLTVLTHPTYTLFFVLTFLLLWVAYDRSLAGLVSGSIVGFGGAILAAPWWIQVVQAFGPTVFFAASGTHGGIGGGVFEFLSGLFPWAIVPLVAACYLLAARYVFLPLWFLIAEFAVQQSRFAYLVGSIVLVVAAVEFGRRRLAASRLTRPGVRAPLFVAFIVVTSTAGVGYLAYDMTDETGTETPPFIDDDDVEAMEWAASETDPEATFVVMGDAAEWFPAKTHRTILVGPWGVEWVSSEAYNRQLDAYANVSACDSESCVNRWLDRSDADPDYLYVPRGGYVIRGSHHVQYGSLERALRLSERYEPAYENEGVVIFRRVRE
ncbi:6-pyruvoyl-tetrahydropterin synthase-related protein [Halegenticoccus tardaugens]|uniref:6-pyruvoyl-tetrahydropterin synthase-related protein n=1 Tax=Halegenticoccus tardaugens TaxID=2071624 RepID=UPI00100BC21E|nr:glycosyltransferase family 39 protein [Halegenticoccus tardaugens]